MHFGSESGAKLVGSWCDNLKNGPGVLSCGNGDLIACNPLFENDKPVHKVALNLPPSPRDGKVMLSETKCLINDLFREVVNVVNKKVNFKK